MIICCPTSPTSPTQTPTPTQVELEVGKSKEGRVPNENNKYWGASQIVTLEGRLRAVQTGVLPPVRWKKALKKSKKRTFCLKI
jgi:hypothetical protein